jgi:hypothetical protein
MFAHLVATGPHPSLGDDAGTYANFIGSWHGTFHDRRGDSIESGPLEVHFAWALEGRAVQDIWIAPGSRAEPGRIYERATYGTTLRVFDPVARVWRVEWFNPVNQVRNTLVGRRVGDRIVQMGCWNDRPQRWQFLDITTERFLWQAHGLDDDGVTWRLQTEFELLRT